MKRFGFRGIALAALILVSATVLGGPAAPSSPRRLSSGEIYPLTVEKRYRAAFDYINELCARNAAITFDDLQYLKMLVDEETLNSLMLACALNAIVRNVSDIGARVNTLQSEMSAAVQRQDQRDRALDARIDGIKCGLENLQRSLEVIGLGKNNKIDRLGGCVDALSDKLAQLESKIDEIGKMAAEMAKNNAPSEGSNGAAK